MQIVEVKNNLVKVSYNASQASPVLSGFVVIKDAIQSFIAQIVYLEATSRGNFAILKLLFTFDNNGVITNYNGSIPDISSRLDLIPSQELLDLLPIQDPFVIGELSQQKQLLSLDTKLLEGKLLICSEKAADNEVLIKNFAKQLEHKGKKFVVIDLQGDLDFSRNKIAGGKDFKLPLNYETINFIYTSLNDAKAETKALIQDVLLEVQNYVKTLPQKFIPFELFKNVVDEQYNELKIIELVLLKNKLLKYYEEGVFAQNKEDFTSLKISLKHSLPTILNLSQVEPDIQREMVAYLYSLISESESPVYVIFNVNNSNSDKKLLKQIFTTKQAYSSLICSYSYKYLKELKQLSKDLILFAPIQQQNDFASYNMFLNKLNPHEFVIYGQATHHLPLIVTLSEISDELAKSSTPSQTEVPVQEQPSAQEEQLDEEIKKDLDVLYTAQKREDETQQEPTTEENIIEEDLTEEDLDLIDNLITEGEESPTEEVLYEEIPTQEEPPEVNILPIRNASTPIVPVYSAEIEPQVQSDEIVQGDLVAHPKYGRGTVEKLIVYGTKTLCSINFDNVGRRLLDPSLAEIKKL